MSNLFEAGLSRRSFMRTLGAASVAATSFPAFAAVQGGMSTQRSRSSATSRDTSGLLDGMSDDFVFISMNENPLGPTPSALEAISTAASMSNRYHSDIVQRTVNTALDLFALKRGYVGLFPGSGGPLNLALASSIGPDKQLVYGDPSYEQGASIADLMGAPKFAVNLTSTYAHDVNGYGGGESEGRGVLHRESE